MLKKIGFVLLGVLVIIQFIRPEKNEGAASLSDITYGYQVPDGVVNILKSKCYDCHSNSTRYPWYYQVQPVAWWMADHIEHAKSHLNFSEFMAYDEKEADHALEELGEVVEEGSMPIDSYLIMHPDARLNGAEQTILLNWVRQLRSGSPN